MIIVAIYDKKAKTYDTPIAVPNAVAATRGFSEQMAKLKDYAKDFELHWLANFENCDTELTDEQKIVLKKEAEIVVKKPFSVLATGEQFLTTEVKIKK